MKRAFLLLPALLLACEDKGEPFDTDATSGEDGWDPPGPNEDDEGDEDDDYTYDDFCTVSVRESYPAAGQEDAYYRGSVEFELSEPDPTASVTLADASGAAVAGALSFNEDGDVVTFTPDQPLAPNTPYIAEITWCEGMESEAAAFQTGGLGEPLTADITGNTYALDLASGRWLAPEGAGELFSSLLEQQPLLSVVSAGATLELRGALAHEDGARQDTCAPTGEGLVSDFGEAPYFAVSAESALLYAPEFPLILADVSLSGAFSADGQSVGGVELRGELDARDLGPLLVDQLEDTHPEYICDLLTGFGIPCEPCASDGEPYCAPVHVVGAVGYAQGFSVEPVLAADCHEACAASCDNAECAAAASFPVCQ